MTYPSSPRPTDVAPGQVPDTGAGSPWSLGRTHPARLASRLAGAALATGIVGGILTAWLNVAFAATDVAPAARVLAGGLPLVLAALIGWRLAQAAGLVESAPSARCLAAVAVAGVAVTAGVQGWPEIGALDDDPAHNAGVALAVTFYGAVLGLMPAVGAIVVLLPIVLLLRASRAPISLPGAQLLLTVPAVALTAVFALWVTRELWVTGEPDTAILAGTAAALAGTGAVLTARWALADRPA